MADGHLCFVRTSPFPISAESAGRYGIDTTGTPFLLAGRVAWLICRLSVANYRSVLDDCVAKAFNTIEMKVPICPSVDNGDGKDPSGNLPFLKRLDGADWTGSTSFTNIANEAPDFTTPNESFWASYDTFFNDCLARRLLVLCFFAYVGFKDTDWWMNIMAANGQTKMQTYGAYIATRYRQQANLVFMLGGDQGTGAIPFDADELAAETGFIAGIESVVGSSRLKSAEWLRNSIATDLFAASISLNGIYPNNAVDHCSETARAYAVSPAKPVFLQEHSFEELTTEPPAVRRMLYWSFLSGAIAGTLFGNGVFTSFDAGVYTSHMNTQGTLDAERMNRYLMSKPWYSLVPTQSAITAGGGTADTETEVRFAVNPAGTFGMAYLPPNHTGTLTLNMTVFSATVTAKWRDPTNATYTNIGSLPNTGTNVFTKPGNNSAGAADWVLELIV